MKCLNHNNSPNRADNSDRRNIGFAATQGMTEDIGLQGSDLNASLTIHRIAAAADRQQVAVSIFYITYILAEVRCTYTQRLGGAQLTQLVPCLDVCEETPVQQSDSRHYLLLGYLVHVHGFHPQCCPAICSPSAPWLVRGLPVPFNDIVPCELVSTVSLTMVAAGTDKSLKVQERGVGLQSFIPLQ